MLNLQQISSKHARSGRAGAIGGGDAPSEQFGKRGLHEIGSGLTGAAIARHELANAVVEGGPTIGRQVAIACRKLGGKPRRRIA